MSLRGGWGVAGSTVGRHTDWTARVDHGACGPAAFPLVELLPGSDVHLHLAEAPLVCVRAVLQLTAQSGVGGTVSSVQDSSECPEFVSEAYVLV